MTTRRIMLTIATDETGERCSPKCHGFSGRDGGPWCEVFRDGLEYAVVPARHDACIEAERAAREAEASAREVGMRDGFDVAETHCGWSTTMVARERLEEEIARIRSGK
jgi:hypothetical protein